MTDSIAGRGAGAPGGATAPEYWSMMSGAPGGTLLTYAVRGICQDQEPEEEVFVHHAQHRGARSR